MAGFGLLGHLAGGYAQAAKEDRARQDAFDEKQRETQLGLSSMILQNPSVPPEYKGPVMEHAISIVNTPRGKKLPSWDKMMSSLPATNTPAKVSNVQQPELTLRPPSIPPGAPQASAAPAVGPSGDTSPAVGALTAPSVSNIGPGNANGIAPPAIPPGPMPTMTIPGATGTATQAPQPVAPAGHFHIMSPEEMAQREQTIQMNKVMEIARQTGKTPAEIMGIKPDLHNIAPGGKLVDSTGKTIAEGGPPLAMASKEKYSVDTGPGGEIRGVIDNTGVRPVHLSPEQAAKIPEANQLLSDAQAALQAHETRLENKESRAFSRQLAIQTQALTNAIQRGAVDDAKKAASDSRTVYEKSQQLLNQDEARYKIMQKAYEDAQKNPDNVGSFDAALLAFHMGMTVGSVKGMRTGKDLIMLHEKARSLPESMKVAAEGWVNGAQLSQEQRANFLQLAQDKMDITRSDVNTARSNYERGYGEYRDFIGGVTKGKVKTPAKAPGTPAAQTSGLQVGQTVTLKNGQTVKIKAVHPDGSFDTE